MKQPDVIGIVGDDIGRELLALYRKSRPGLEGYGNAYEAPFPYANLPNLDALARNGITFTSCVTTPVCSATRAAALTGLYPFQNGLGSLIRGAAAQTPTTSPTFTDLGKQRGATIRSLAHHAKANGYHCIATGKWHLFLDSDAPDYGSGPLHPTRAMGFDRWDGTPRNPDPNFNEYVWYAWDAAQQTPVITHETSTHLTQKVSQVASEAWLAARAEHPNQPIFHWIAFNAAHAAEGKFDFPPNGTTQHNFGDTPPPDEWSNTRVRAGLEHLDFWIGQYFAAIGYDPENPTPSDPVVFFWGDNGTDTNAIADVPGKGGSAPWPKSEPNYPAGHPGWQSTGETWSGDHSLELSIAPYDTTHFKGFVYVDGTTVPLLFAGNSNFIKRAGAVDDSMIDVVDLFPTLANLMQAGSGTQATGRIKLSNIPANGDVLSVSDGWSGTLRFEWRDSGVSGANNITVPISRDLASATSALEAALQSAVDSGRLLLEVTRDGNAIVLNNALRGYEGNQRLRASGSAMEVNGMSGGATAPSALAGFSFHERLSGQGPALRNYSAAGMQFGPNGLSQSRDFELRSYVREEGEHRWALLNLRRSGPEVVEFYDIGTPKESHARGSIRFLENLNDGDSVSVSDDFRHDAKTGSGSGITLVARSNASLATEFSIGASTAHTLAALASRIENSALQLQTDIVGDTLRLTNLRAGYCGNDALETNSLSRIRLVGMAGGSAPDQRQTCDLNSAEYRDGNGEHPAFEPTVIAANNFLGLRASTPARRTAQLSSAGSIRAGHGGARVAIEGLFVTGSTFRVFDILISRASDQLRREQIISWDLLVHEHDPNQPHALGSRVHSRLGMDPEGTNPDGFPYISKSPQTAGGWDSSLSDFGYQFRLDIDTRYFRHEVGKTYSFQLVYATLYEGKASLRLDLQCVAPDRMQ